MWHKLITYTGQFMTTLAPTHTELHPNMYVICTHNKFKRSSHMYGTITVIRGEKLVEASESACILNNLFHFQIKDKKEHMNSSHLQTSS